MVPALRWRHRRCQKKATSRMIFQTSSPSSLTIGFSARSAIGSPNVQMHNIRQPFGCSVPAVYGRVHGGLAASMGTVAETPAPLFYCLVMKTQKPTSLFIRFFLIFVKETRFGQTQWHHISYKILRGRGYILTRKPIHWLERIIR